MEDALNKSRPKLPTTWDLASPYLCINQFAFAAAATFDSSLIIHLNNRPTIIMT